MRGRGHRAALYAAVSVWVALTGCVSGTESIVADVSPEGWHEPVDLRYSNTDTLTYRHLGLTIRHSSNADAPDGRFTLAMISPSHVIKIDTLRVAIGLQTQNNGMQQTQATPLLVRLAESGEWRFVVTPLQNIVGVWSVGIDLK